jgi:hypothetical protein
MGFLCFFSHIKVQCLITGHDKLVSNYEYLVVLVDFPHLLTFCCRFFFSFNVFSLFIVVVVPGPLGGYSYP